MKKLLRFAALAIVSSFVLAGRVTATPAGEITRAANVSGGSVSNEAFLSAFGAVLARVNSRQLADYVRAAISLRPDLQNEILNTALTVRASSDPRVRQTEVTAIVRAAVRAANGHVNQMIVSAVNAHPDESKLIALAWTSATPTSQRDAAIQMLLVHMGHGARHGRHGGDGDGEGEGDDDDDDDVRSPEKPPRDS